MRHNDCACFYCGALLAGTRHEHDHAPVPQRHGGDDTVPACHSCHSLKDRIPLERWPVSMMVEAIEQCGPLGRIFLAKAFAVDMDRTDLAATA